jgi:hypothetical protein
MSAPLPEADSADSTPDSTSQFGFDGEQSPSLRRAHVDAAFGDANAVQATAPRDPALIKESPRT